MWLIIVISTALSAFIIKWLLDYGVRLFHYPPGPWGLPIVGYLPWMGGKQPFEIFVKLGEKYGGLFSVGMGIETIVVLNDWSSIRATLVEKPKIFCGRPEIKLLTEAYQRKDFALNDGPIAKKQRTLAIHCLKDLGVGKTASESIIMDVVEDVIEQFMKHDNQAVVINDILYPTFVQLTYKLVSGGHEMKKDKVAAIAQALHNFVSGFRSDNPLNVFLWLRYVPPNGFGYWEFLKIIKHLKQLMLETIEKHLDNWNEHNMNDLIDYYIAEMKKKADNSPPYNVEHLQGTVFDLFAAGVDTVNNTTQWGLSYLVKYPSIQTKIQMELDKVVGRERLPNLNDIPSLPYLEAFIKEVHRFSCVVPLALPHRTTTTIDVNGYTIPRGTTCLQNIYAVHRDPKLWNEPEVFNPDRFFDDENKPITPPYLMPFSIGPRACVGQSFAEMQLRLLFSCFLQKFTFSLPDNQKELLIEPVYRVTLVPPPFALKINIR
ncbi:hypothetical protein CHUAL_008467 [Chamberlinius hualienensis]